MATQKKKKVEHGKEDEAFRGPGCRKKIVLSRWASLKLSRNPK